MGREILELTAAAAHRLGARRGYGDVGGIVPELSDRASGTQRCVVPCQIELEDMRVPLSVRRNAIALRKGMALGRVAPITQRGYV